MSVIKPLRVVLQSEFPAGATARGLVPGLRARGWLVDEIDINNHPEERAAVAARGHARAVPAYSYTERAHELAALVEQKLGRQPGSVNHP